MKAIIDCNSKDTIEKWTGINVSIAVAPTKVLEKTANRLAKKEKEKKRVHYGW